MALFQRIKSPFTDNEPAAQGPLSSEAHSAGDVLRRRRLAMDIDLSDVATALKIKPGYLAAIEEGRPNRLPGAAYALGFVRSYSEYLGLNTVEVLRQFKAEAAGLNATPDLTFPMPLSERNLPGRGVLTTAIILAFCGYGVWYYLAVTEKAPERVREVPAELLSAKHEAANRTKVTASAASDPSPAGSSAHTAGAERDLIRPEAGVSAAARADVTDVAAGSVLSRSGPATTSAVSVTRSPPSPAPASAMAATSAKATVSVAAPPAAPVSSLTETAATQTAASGRLSPPEAGFPLAGASTETSQGAPVLSEAVTSPQPANDIGAVQDPSRIVLRANADSWIQIRAANHSVLYTGLLKPGEVYRVPDRAGLTMRAGNAGGLDIIVDGKPTQSLGPMGTVRNVSLDPQTLTGQGAGRD